MRHLLLSLVLLCTLISNAKAQKSTASNQAEVVAFEQEDISLANIEFTIYPNPSDMEFKVEFLLPRDQLMEMYLININGDRVKQLLSRQLVEGGVRAYDFSFPASAPFGMYFLVIKSNKKSVIKKLEYQAGQ